MNVKGPYVLSASKICRLPHCPGVYMLANKANKILVVGWSREDLNKELKEYIENSDDKNAVQFWYKGTQNARLAEALAHGLSRAYKLECIETGFFKQ